jgi:hypothetical protein
MSLVPANHFQIWRQGGHGIRVVGFQAAVATTCPEMSGDDLIGSSISGDQLDALPWLSQALGFTA